MKSYNPTPTAATGEAGPVAELSEKLVPFSDKVADKYEIIFDRDGDVCIRRAMFDDDGIKQVTHWPDPCEFKPVKEQFKTLLRQRDELRAALKRLMPYADTLLEKANMSRQFEIGYVAALQSARAALASVQPEAKP